MDFLREEESLVFHAVLPFGNTLKCIAELLLRCASHTPLTVDRVSGITFMACDQTSGRLIHIQIHPGDMLQFVTYSDVKFRCTLETSSLFASFHLSGLLLNVRPVNN